MKTTTLALFSTLLFIFGTASAETKYEAGSFKIDGAHSKVGFEIGHMVISTVEGKFDKYDGTIELATPFEKSKVETNVDVDSINTGIKDRDDHLRSPDFFDTKKFPKMTFKSTEIKGTPESFKLTGDLTLHGVTKKVTFDSKYLGQVKDGRGNLKSAFEGNAKISRKDFGLKWSKLVEAGPVVGDEVKISLKLEADMPLPKK